MDQQSSPWAIRRGRKDRSWPLDNFRQHEADYSPLTISSLRASVLVTGLTIFSPYPPSAKMCAMNEKPASRPAHQWGRWRGDHGHRQQRLGFHMRPSVSARIWRVRPSGYLPASSPAGRARPLLRCYVMQLPLFGLRAAARSQGSPCSMNFWADHAIFLHANFAHAMGALFRSSHFANTQRGNAGDCPLMLVGVTARVCSAQTKGAIILFAYLVTQIQLAEFRNRDHLSLGFAGLA